MRRLQRGQKLSTGKTRSLILKFLINEVHGIEEYKIRNYLRHTTGIQERKGVRKHLEKLSKDHLILLENKPGLENEWRPNLSLYAFQQLAKKFLLGADDDKIAFMTSKYLEACLTERLIGYLTLDYIFGRETLLQSIKTKYPKLYKEVSEVWSASKQSQEHVDNYLIGLGLEKIEKTFRNFWRDLQKAVFLTILSLSPTALSIVMFGPSLVEVHNKVKTDYSMIPLIRNPWSIETKNPSKRIDKRRVVLFDALYTVFLTSLISDIFRFPSLINTKDKHEDLRVLFGMPLRWDYTFYDKPKRGSRPKVSRSGIISPKNPRV